MGFDCLPLLLPQAGQAGRRSEFPRLCFLLARNSQRFRYDEHARIVSRASQFLIRSLGDSVLRVNGVQIEEKVLAHGDQLELGSATLLFLDENLPQERWLLTLTEGDRSGEEVEVGELLTIGRASGNSSPRASLR